MAIQGLRDSSNFVAEARPKNWREGIMLLQPNGMTPLYALSSMMKKRSVDDPEFNWWEKQTQSRRVELNANLTLSGTEATVIENALGFKKNDVLRVMQTGELLRVSSDPSSDTKLTLQRGFGGTTPAAVTYNGAGVNPWLQCIGTAMPEGSLDPTGVMFDPTKAYNYTQIFRHTLEATRTAMKTRLRTGDQIKEAKRETLELHSIDIERAMWFGTRFEGALDGKPQRMMGGIESFIDSNNILTPGVDNGGPLDWSGVSATGIDMQTMEDAIELLFRKGSQEKMGFCGNRALLTIQQIARKNASYELVQGQKEFGMNVSRLVSPFGELVLKTHPLFNQMTSGKTGGTQFWGVDSWLFALDMAELKYVHLTDSDTKYEAELGANGLDGMKSGYLTECSIEIHHPETHMLIKNMGGAAADA